jgi:hypothetical protein
MDNLTQDALKCNDVCYCLCMLTTLKIDDILEKSQITHILPNQLKLKCLLSPFRFPVISTATSSTMTKILTLTAM